MSEDKKESKVHTPKSEKKEAVTKTVLGEAHKKQDERKAEQKASRPCHTDLVNSMKKQTSNSMKGISKEEFLKPKSRAKEKNQSFPDAKKNQKKQA